MEGVGVRQVEVVGGEDFSLQVGVGAVSPTIPLAAAEEAEVVRLDPHRLLLIREPVRFRRTTMRSRRRLAAPRLGLRA